jgi:hypothetical protein
MDDRGVVAAPRDRLESDARTPAHGGQAVRTPKAARKQLRLIKNFARSASTPINREQAPKAQRHNGSPAALPDSAGWQPASRDKLEAYPPSNSPPL